MDSSGRFLLAILLMVAVVVGTNLLFPPVPPPQQAGDGAVDTVVVEEPEPETTAEAPAASAVGPPTGVAEAPPEPVRAAVPADTIVVESPLFRYAFSTRGAAVVSAELLEFESFTREGSVQLVPDDVGALVDYAIRVDGRTIELGDLDFAVEPEAGLDLEGEAARELRFVHRDPGGAFLVELTYIFEPDAYRVGVQGRIVGLGDAPLLLLGLGPRLAINEANTEEDERALAYVVNSREEGIRSVPLRDVDERRIEEGPLFWTAVRSKYFLLAAISEGEGEGRYFGGVIAETTPAGGIGQITATLPVGRDERFAYTLYMGPQEYSRLTALGGALEDVNPYGWKIFQPIIRPLAHVITWLLVEMHNALGLGYGWVLILFGVLMRVILWPLNARAMRSQMKNMEIQPRMKEIQERYKDNPEKLQKEMIRLYKEEGFNPLGGCLPMLIPYPVLITLFFVFQNTIEFRGVDFLWLPDLSRPDPYYILPLLLGVSMFLMQWISQRSMPQTNPQMKMMMWFMPGMLVVIFLNLASGLNLYYAASNLASVPQQYQIARERARVKKRIEAD